MSSYREDLPHISGTIELAVRICEMYPSRPPTAGELAFVFGMSRATSHRWARAIRDARPPREVRAQAEATHTTTTHPVAASTAARAVGFARASA